MQIKIDGHQPTGAQIILDHDVRLQHDPKAWQRGDPQGRHILLAPAPVDVYLQAGDHHVIDLPEGL